MFSKVGLTVLSATLVEGYTTFNIECVAPNQTFNFVSAPNTRGTLSILWSCLFTIFACTWTVLHLDIPEQRLGRDPGLRGDIKWKLKGYWSKCEWMIITVLLPEFVLVKNLGDFFRASEGVDRFREFAEEDEVPWSKTHELFANMGGFVVRSNVETEEPSIVHPLRSHHLYLLRENGLLLHNMLPNISIEEIRDKSKSDSLVRVIAIVQILWMMAQVILRQVEHLAVSQLEVAVLAFALMAVVIYIINWDKPQGVETPVIVLTYPQDIPDVVATILAIDRDKYKGLSRQLYEMSCGLGVLRDAGRASNCKYNREGGGGSNLMLLIWAVSNAAFGVIHFIAWNFVFPTPTELVLWRGATVFLTVGAPLYIGFFTIFERFEDCQWPKFLHGSILNFSHSLTFLYLLCRLYIIVETFHCLMFLPPSVYIATLSAEAPRVG